MGLIFQFANVDGSSRGRDVTMNTTRDIKRVLLLEYHHIAERIKDHLYSTLCNLTPENHVPSNAKPAAMLSVLPKCTNPQTLENARPRHNIMKLFQRNASTNTCTPIRLLYHILE